MDSVLMTGYGSQENEASAAVARELGRHTWQVEQDVAIGGMQPDLVAISPAGRGYVLEFRFGHGKTHFGSVAQVESMAGKISDLRTGPALKPILVTNEDVSAAAADAARTIGVQIIETGGSVSDIAEAVVEQLAHDDALQSSTASTARSSKATFEVYKDRSGDYRWRLRHANGRVIATGGGHYRSKDEAIEDINELSASARTAALSSLGEGHSVEG